MPIVRDGLADSRATSGLTSPLVLTKRPIKIPITTARYKGPTMLVATLIIRASGSTGAMSPNPTVVKQTKAK